MPKANLPKSTVSDPSPPIKDPATKNRTTRLASHEMGCLIDLERYPIDRLDTAEGQALIARCQADLDRDASAILPGFLRAEALVGLTAEAEALIPESRRFERVPRVTYPQGDPGDGSALSEEVRAMKHLNANNQILNYMIPNYSDLRAIYLWPDGWHYDPNDGVVTLLLQAPDAGGEFEYAPNIRSDDDQNYEGVKQLFANPETEGRRVPQAAGTFTFFNGKNSMHRVKPVGKTSKPRIVAIFSYDQRPDQVFGQYYVEMLHTLPQGAPLRD
jgi:hypothetical protein